MSSTSKSLAETAAVSFRSVSIEEFLREWFHTKDYTGPVCLFKHDPAGPWTFVGTTEDFAGAFAAFVKKTSTIIPVPMGWSWTSPTAKHLVRELTRHFITKEKGTTEALRDFDTIQYLYFTVLSGLLLQLDQWETMTPATQALHLKTVFVAVRTFQGLLADDHPEAVKTRKIVLGVSALPAANNMMERAVAFLLLNRTIDPIDVLHMFEHTVLRGKLPSRLGDYVAYGMGILAMFIALPAMQDFLASSETFEAALEVCMDTFTKQKAMLTERFSAILADHPHMGAEALRIVTTQSPLFTECPCDLTCTTALLGFKGPKGTFRWNPFFPALFPELEFRVHLGPFAVNGGAAVGKSTHLQVISPTTGQFTSQNGIDWSGIQLPLHGLAGTLRIDLGLLGNATGAAGNTLGADLTANVRFTTGNKLIDKHRTGLALSGMVSGDGSFRPLERSLDPAHPLLLTLTAAGVVTVQNNGRICATTLQITASQPLLIAFKNCILTATWTAAPVAAAAAAAAAHASSGSWAARAAASPAPSSGGGARGGAGGDPFPSLSSFHGEPEFEDPVGHMDAAVNAERRAALAASDRTIAEISKNIQVLRDTIALPPSSLSGEARAKHLSTLAAKKAELLKLTAALEDQKLVHRVLSMSI